MERQEEIDDALACLLALSGEARRGPVLAGLPDARRAALQDKVFAMAAGPRAELIERFRKLRRAGAPDSAALPGALQAWLVSRRQEVHG
jgi:hypothetical protein